MRRGQIVDLQLEAGPAVGRFVRAKEVAVRVPDALNLSGSRSIVHRLAVVQVGREVRHVAVERVRPRRNHAR